jgi:phosphate transport system permease protein
MPETSFLSLLSFRRSKDRLARTFFWTLAALPVILITAILILLLIRSWPILTAKSLAELFAGRTWLPNKGLFGFLPFIVGTVWVTIVAMVIAVPPCIFTAIFLAEYARPRLQSLMKPLLDLLSAIPSVVYGVWGMLTIVPLVQSIGPTISNALGVIPIFKSHNPTGFSVLAGGIVLAVMIAPFIIAVTYEVLRTVPGGYREASLAIGATKWETVRYAVIPKTLPGIIAGSVLGASRALGETMAVLMVVGNVPKVSLSIFDPAYPLPALIANNYGEMMSIPLYDAALMTAALVLLIIVLLFNITSTFFLRSVLRKGHA